MTDSTAIPLPVRSALLGLFSGGRSFSPLAVLALLHDDPSTDGDWKRWPVLRSSGARAGLVLGAIGELIGDVLPFTPSRTKPGPLIGRMTTGAIAGAAIGTLHGADARRSGAALGAVGGLAGSFAGSLVRAAGSKIGLPDLLVALLEDAVVLLGTATVLTAE